MSEEQEQYEMAKKIYAETFVAMAGRLASDNYTPDDYQYMADVAREMTECAVKEFYKWHWPWLLGHEQEDVK